MNTTYKPVDRIFLDRIFLEMLAAAKARGVTWMRLAEMTKKPVVELEVIPWREPKEWAKACKYAEKLLQHEALSEMLAQLRVQMNDNVNNARSKSQVANSVVRVIQLQHALRTPKKTKKAKVRATPEPTPMPVPTSPTVNEPVVTSPTSPVNVPKSANSTPVTVATIFLLLLGAFAWGRAMPLEANDSLGAITQGEQPEGCRPVDVCPQNPLLLTEISLEEGSVRWAEGCQENDVAPFAVGHSVRESWFHPMRPLDEHRHRFNLPWSNGSRLDHPPPRGGQYKPSIAMVYNLPM